MVLFSKGTMLYILWTQVFPLSRILWSLCPHHFRPLTWRPDYNHKAKSSHTAFISVNLFSERGIFLTLCCSWSSSLTSSHSVAEEDGVRKCWVRTNDLSYLAAEMERLALGCVALARMWRALWISGVSSWADQGLTGFFFLDQVPVFRVSEEQ